MSIVYLNLGDFSTNVCQKAERIDQYMHGGYLDARSEVLALYSATRHWLRDWTRARRCCADMMKAEQHVEESKGRNRHHSPAASVSSSQQDVHTGSSMSTSGSSEPTDIMSPVVDNRTTIAPPMPDSAQVIHFRFCSMWLMTLLSSLCLFFPHQLDVWENTL